MKTIANVDAGAAGELLSLDDAGTATDPAISGAKAAALAALKRAGEPVPEGAVIPPSVAAEAAAVAVGARFGGKRLAVRSSSLAEDTVHASYAGQYLTVLDVEADDSAAVASAIRSVRASAAAPAPGWDASRSPDVALGRT